MGSLLDSVFAELGWPRVDLLKIEWRNTSRPFHFVGPVKVQVSDRASFMINHYGYQVNDL